MIRIITPPGRGRSIAISLSVCMSASGTAGPIFTKFQICYADPLWPWLGPALTASLRYVLPVLRMTSRLAVVGRMAMRGYATLRYRGGV